MCVFKGFDIITVADIDLFSFPSIDWRNVDDHLENKIRSPQLRLEVPKSADYSRSKGESLPRDHTKENVADNSRSVTTEEAVG